MLIACILYQDQPDLLPCRSVSKLESPHRLTVSLEQQILPFLVRSCQTSLYSNYRPKRVMAVLLDVMAYLHSLRWSLRTVLPKQPAHEISQQKTLMIDLSILKDLM